MGIMVPYKNGVPNESTILGYLKTYDRDGVDATGAMHNGAESLFVQTDEVNGDLLPRGILSADGLTFDQKSYAQLLAFYNNSNGADGVWLKLMQDGYSIKPLSVYDWAWWNAGITVPEADRLVTYYGGTSAAWEADGEYVTDENNHVEFFAAYGV